MLEYPFLRQIIDGTLDREKFTKYMVQDTLYLKYYAKVYAWGIIKTDDISLMRRLYRDMGDVIISNESVMHYRYLTRLGYTEEQALAVPMETVTREYIDFMLTVSENGSFEEGMVSLMPCALSYYYIAVRCRERALQNGTYENNFYREWFDDLAGPEFKLCNDSTLELCRVISENADEAAKNRLEEIFRISTDHEFKFWKMAYGEL